MVEVNTNPSCICVDKTTVKCQIFIKKLGNRYSEEKGEPSYEEIPHGIHVCELKKG